MSLPGISVNLPGFEDISQPGFSRFERAKPGEPLPIYMVSPTIAFTFGGTANLTSASPLAATTTFSISAAATISDSNSNISGSATLSFGGSATLDAGAQIESDTTLTFSSTAALLTTSLGNESTGLVFGGSASLSVIDSLLPNFTSNTTPAPWVASASGETNPAYTAADGADDTAWGVFMNSPPQWWMVQSPTNLEVSSYKIKAGPVSFMNAVPAMTSNTTPSGVASAFPGNDLAFYAFNHTTTGFAWNPTAYAPGWIQYQYAAAKTIVSYALACGPSVQDSMPKDFTLSGSNNGSSWTQIDSRTGIVWSSGQRQEFSVASAGSYLYYRLNVTALQGPPESQFILLHEFEMSEATGIFFPPTQFKLQGSSNGTSWTDLDSRSGISWSPGEEKTFEVSSPALYSYHRLLFEAANTDQIGRMYIPSIKLIGH